MEGRIEDCDVDLTDAGTTGVLLPMLGRPGSIPTDLKWVHDWHLGVPLGEAVAAALLAQWGAE